MRACCRRDEPVDREAHHSLSSVKTRGNAGRPHNATGTAGVQRFSLRSCFVYHDGHPPNGLAALVPIIREGISDSLPHIALAGDLSGPLVHILFVLLEPDPYLHTTLLPCRAGFRSTLSPAPPAKRDLPSSLVQRLCTQTSPQEIKFR